MDINLPVFAGAVSTVIFAASAFPMLQKAFRTKDLQSYSPGNIVRANGGNAIHSVYVFNLPPGPIWLLHTFYLITTGMMLFWYLRYEGWPRRASALMASPRTSPEHGAPDAIARGQVTGEPAESGEVATAAAT
jgi:hypothetical protein